jgi:hypothetical protein
MQTCHFLLKDFAETRPLSLASWSVLQSPWSVTQQTQMMFSQHFNMLTISRSQIEPVYMTSGLAKKDLHAGCNPLGWIPECNLPPTCCRSPFGPHIFQWSFHLSITIPTNTATWMCSLLPRRSHTCLAYSSTFEVRHQHPPMRGANRKVSRYPLSMSR